MADSLNKVLIIGNLGKDPEMRYMPNGKPVTNFSVATNRRWNTPDGDQREETEWFNVTMYEKLADIANQYLTKGQKVYIEGRLHTRSWDGNDGQKHYRTEIIANQMIMLGAGRGQGSREAVGERFDNEPESQPSDNDLPF